MRNDTQRDLYYHLGAEDEKKTSVSDRTSGSKRADPTKIPGDSVEGTKS